MKIPFNIKYRDKIESGEYKVVTECDKPVEIVYWEGSGPYKIVGYVKDDTRVRSWTVDGKYYTKELNQFLDGILDNSLNLYILTPYDYTPWELEVGKAIYCDMPVVYFINPEYVKQEAKRLKEWLMNSNKNIKDL